jgi:hypothetical protein
MNVKGQGAMRPQCLDNGWPKRNIGHKMAVHHIQMDPVRPGMCHGFYFFSQPCKIRSQNTRGDQGEWCSTHSLLIRNSSRLRNYRKTVYALLHGNCLNKGQVLRLPG